MLRDLALARILGTVNFGLWVSFSVARQYSAYSDLGFTNGLARILPRALYENDKSTAERAMGVAWLVAMAATVGAAVLLVAREWLWGSGPGQLTVGVLALLVLMFLDKHQMYSSAVYASTQRVGASGLYFGQLGATELVLCIALAPAFGITGVYFGVVGAALLTVAFMYTRQPIRARRGWDSAALRPLAAASFVLMGFGLTNIALHNMDRVAIIIRLGAGTQLAEYHVASILSLMVNVVPYIVLSVLIPQMYRFSKHRALELKPYLLLPSAVIAMSGVLIASLAWLVAPPFFRLYLPAFQTDTALLGPLLLAELCFSVAMVPGNIMVAQDRGAVALIVRVGVVIAGFSGSLVVLGSGGSTTKVAWVMTAVQALSLLALGLLASRSLTVPFIRFLIVTIAPAAYGVIVQLAIYAVLGTADSVGGLLVQILVTIVLLAPFTVVALGWIGRGPLTGQSAQEFLYRSGSA